MFRAGNGGDIGGIQWRVVQGKKSPSDLRLELRSPNWVATKMSVGFLFADFYAQNERVLAQEGYLPRGVVTNPGRMYLRHVEGAMVVGWEAAAELLEEQRRLRRMRDAA